MIANSDAGLSNPSTVHNTPELLEKVAAVNIRYVERSIHRGEHLDEIDQALRT